MKKNHRLWGALVTAARTALAGMVMVAASLLPVMAGTAFAATTVTVVATPGADGSSVTFSGTITSGGYDAASLVVDYGLGLALTSDVPVTITSTHSGGYDGFSATAKGVPAGSYTYSLTDDNNVSFTGGSGSFVIAGPTASVSGVTVTPGADGKSVVVTGSITSGGYDAATLSMDYGAGQSLGSSVPVTITAMSSGGTDAFSASVAGLSAGSYSYSIGDKNVDQFNGGSGTFSVTGVANTTGGGTGSNTGGGTTTGGGATGGSGGVKDAVPVDTSTFHLSNTLGVTTIQDLLAKIINAMVLIATPIIVIMLIYSGFLFVQASGNEEKLGKAKTTLMYTLIGAAVILGAKGISFAIQNTLSQF